MIVIESLDLSTLTLTEIGSGNIELPTGEEMDGDPVYVSYLDRETYEKQLIALIGGNPLDFHKMPLLEAHYYKDPKAPNVREYICLMSCTEAMARKRIKELSDKALVQEAKAEFTQSVAS